MTFSLVPINFTYKLIGDQDSLDNEEEEEEYEFLPVGGPIYQSCKPSFKDDVEIWSQTFIAKTEHGNIVLEVEIPNEMEEVDIDVWNEIECPDNIQISEDAKFTLEINEDDEDEDE